MYYKILNKQSLLDVIVDPKYVRRGKNGALQKTEYKEAQGICSSNGSKVWNIEGRIPLYQDEEVVRIVEINFTEFLALKEALESEQQENNIELTDDEAVLTTDEISLDYVKKQKIKIMSQECSTAIVNGLFIKLSDGQQHHFELSLEDQINLLSLQKLMSETTENIPYHETGEPCRLYSRQDFLTILNEVNKHRLYHTVYFNNLKTYINVLEDIDKISRIYYGSPIPEEYQTEALKSLLK